MFIKAIDMLPRYVDGKKFTEHSLIGSYRGYELNHTTIFMNDKPIIKKLDILSDNNLVKHLWRSLKSRHIDKF